jgi:hypothetical protein
VLVGVEDLRRGLVDQLVGPVAEEALGGGVDDPDGALRVGVDHRVFGTVEDGPLQAGGFAQLAFGAGVLVDLAGEAPVGVGQGADVAAEGVVGFGEGLGFSSTWRRTASARLCTVCWMATASRVSSSPPTSQRPDPLSSSAPAPRRADDDEPVTLGEGDAFGVGAEALVVLSWLPGAAALVNTGRGASVVSSTSTAKRGAPLRPSSGATPWRRRARCRPR